jgi:nucleoside-diphosphate-sugar epimerase
MQIIITGGAGFIGQRLAKEIVQSSIEFKELLLVDIIEPPKPTNDPRLKSLQIDLSISKTASRLINVETGLVFHLAAVVSSHAEEDFDIGWKVNLDITRNLLEACRQTKANIKFVFASSLAVYGGDLPKVVTDQTALTPQSSYGTQKAMGELLVNDYTRKKYVDGRVLRLPTICVRPGKPNKAASSFVSSIIREPLHGETAICPVATNLSLWLSSPDTVIKNIIKAAQLNAGVFGHWLTVNLPGVGVTVKEMLEALEKQTDKKTMELVKFEPDETIEKIVSSWPAQIDNTRALNLGFELDGGFESFITQFLKGDA